MSKSVFEDLKITDVIPDEASLQMSYVTIASSRYKTFIDPVNKRTYGPGETVEFNIQGRDMIDTNDHAITGKYTALTAASRVDGSFNSIIDTLTSAHGGKDIDRIENYGPLHAWIFVCRKVKNQRSNIILRGMLQEKKPPLEKKSQLRVWTL